MLTQQPSAAHSKVDGNSNKMKPHKKTGSYFILILSLLCAAVSCGAREFTVLTYNVENLFDLDDIAVFEDYRTEDTRNPQPYSPLKVLTKIENIARVLKTIEDPGGGPAVILFQEFERDRTPDSTVTDYKAFLERYKGVSLETLLTTERIKEIKGVPVQALVLKYFEDNGLKGYNVAIEKDSTDNVEERSVHSNSVFSKFPIRYERYHHTKKARPIQEVSLDVAGHELIVINVHWKSGASSERSESIRVVNALDTRKVVEDILAEKPSADIIVAGDFNTYYNAATAFKDWTVDEYSIAAFGSQGDELALRRDSGPIFYNLWFELPEEDRRNELWQSKWGTLMQYVLTPALYDYQGIQYVDNSFQKLAIKGLNAGKRWGEPIGWRFYGEKGGGYSDHLPLMARFRLFINGDANRFMRLEKPTLEESAPEKLYYADYREISKKDTLSAKKLKGLSDEEVGHYFGEFFYIQETLVSSKPLAIRIDDRTYELFSLSEQAMARLRTLGTGNNVSFIGELGEYHGRVQFLIREQSWLE